MSSHFSAIFRTATKVLFAGVTMWLCPFFAGSLDSPDTLWSLPINPRVADVRARTGQGSLRGIASLLPPVASGDCFSVRFGVGHAGHQDLWIFDSFGGPPAELGQFLTMVSTLITLPPSVDLFQVEGSTGESASSVLSTSSLSTAKLSKTTASDRNADPVPGVQMKRQTGRH